MTQLVLFDIFNGLIIGAFYALMALGLSLILNLSGVINFAHGGFLALGGYLAYTLIPYIGFWGARLASPILTAIIGVAIECTLIRRLYGRDPLYSLLFTFGLAFVLEDGTRFIWGAATVPFSVPNWMAAPLSTRLFFLTGYRLFMVWPVMVYGCWLCSGMLTKKPGSAYASAPVLLDLETVSSLGVNVRLLLSLNFGLGIFLAGLAGVLAAGMLGIAADDRQRAHHAELCCDHHRRPGQLAGYAVGWAADRCRLRAYHRILSLGHPRSSSTS